MIETNTFNVAIGGVLSQDQGNGLYPVAYYTKELTGAAGNFVAREHKQLVIIVVFKKWCAYIDIKCRCVITDYVPLTALQLQPNLLSHQINCSQCLGAFSLFFEYLPRGRYSSP